MTTTPTEIPATTNDPEDKTLYFVPEWIVADGGSIIQVSAICAIAYVTPPAGMGVPYALATTNDGNHHRFNDTRFHVSPVGLLWNKPQGEKYGDNDLDVEE
jgi:hypothetical protein